MRRVRHLVAGGLGAVLISACNFNFPTAPGRSGSGAGTPTGPGVPGEQKPATGAALEGIVETFAGYPSSADGPAPRVWLWGLFGLAADGAGNVFFAESAGRRVRKLTAAGQVITIAGSWRKEGYVDESGPAARFIRPMAVAWSPAGDLFVGEWNAPRIRKISPSGVVGTLAGNGTKGFRDGPGDQAMFNNIWSLAVAASGYLLVADGGPRIRAVAPDGTVRTMAGTAATGSVDGPVADARFDAVVGLAVDATGNVYVADANRHRIRKIDTRGQVSTLAGRAATGSADGTRDDATLFVPTALAVDAGGNVYFTSFLQPKIRRISPAGNVTTLAGADSGGYADGTGAAARFEEIAGMTLLPGGDLLVSEISTTAPHLRRVTPGGKVSTVAGSQLGSKYADGPIETARFYGPAGLAFDAAGNLYVVDNANYRLRKIDTGGKVTTLAGSGEPGFADGSGTAARFGICKGIAVDPGGTAYVADFGNNRIRKVDPQGRVTTLAGSGRLEHADGPGASAGLQPNDVAVGPDGNVYVADLASNRVRRIDPAGNVSTLAGSGERGHEDGPAAKARFAQLQGITVDARGTVYVSEIMFDRSWVGIRKITAGGEVSTVAGGPQGFADGYGGTGRFDNLPGMAVDPAGNLFVADWKNRRIRRVDPAGAVTTLAGGGPAEGDGDPEFADGRGTAARFNAPFDVAFGPDGRLYVGDIGDMVIRVIR